MKDKKQSNNKNKCSKIAKLTDPSAENSLSFVQGIHCDLLIITATKCFFLKVF